MTFHKIQDNSHDVRVDLTRALQDVACNRELLSDLAAFYEEDAPKICREIATAVTQESWDKVTRLAHSLKNMSSQFRAEPTTSMATKLEDLSRLRARDEITTEFIASISESIDSVICELRKAKLR
jgi:HPt (histidine-containing phosphotransfer) domain-containing protein